MHEAHARNVTARQVFMETSEPSLIITPPIRAYVVFCPITLFVKFMEALDVNPLSLELTESTERRKFSDPIHVQALEQSN